MPNTSKINGRDVVAIGFLSRHDLDVLGQGFRRHFAVDDLADFTDLIEKLDRIDFPDDDAKH